MLLYNPWIWLAVAILMFALCTYIPVKIEDDRKRQLAYWIILVPVSIVIIAYIYPVGIEICKRWAVGA